MVPRLPILCVWRRDCSPALVQWGRTRERQRKVEIFPAYRTSFRPKPQTVDWLLAQLVTASPVRTCNSSTTGDLRQRSWYTGLLLGSTTPSVCTVSEKKRTQPLCLTYRTNFVCAIDLDCMRPSGLSFGFSIPQLNNLTHSL